MTVLFSFLLTLGAYAQNHNDHHHVETIVPNAPIKLNGPCSAWVLDSSVSCVLVDGARTKVWRRQCEHIWDNETFCWNGNPNALSMICTPWYREDAECVSDEDVWVRECGDVRYKKHLCSETNPNTQQ